MAKLTDRAFKAAFGTSNARKAGRERTLRGLREGTPTDIYLGLALTAIGYLQRTKPKKQLIYRQEIREDSVLVIHHKGSEDAKLEILRPQKERPS